MGEGRRWCAVLYGVVREGLNVKVALSKESQEVRELACGVDIGKSVLKVERATMAESLNGSHWSAPRTARRLVWLQQSEGGKQ